jgi:PAS domain S-box-containing protein
LARAVKGELARLQYVGVVMDVTARVRAEEALRASEHSLRLLVDNIPSHVWTGTPAGEVESVNQPVVEYTGKTPEELKGWTTVVHPDDLERVLAAWKHSAQTGGPFDTEVRLRRADGVYRWFHSRVLAMRDAEGRVVRWYSLVTDIDERKNTEEALRASERNLQLIVETIPGYAWCGTPSGEVEFVNKGILGYSGKTLDEIKNWACVVHPDDVDTLGRTWFHSVETGEPYEIEFRFRRFDGVYRWFVTRGLPLRDSDGLIGRWYGLLYDVDLLRHQKCPGQHALADLGLAQWAAVGH